MKFLAKLQHMAASEIMNIIPNDIYEEIKHKDPHPLFQAYVVGHEGEASAKAVGIGQKVLHWFSSAINKLWANLKYGTKVFHGHNIDSSHEGRQSIGEVVGKAVKTIQSKVNAIAITYIYPEFKDLPLNIASIEADVKLNPDETVHDIDVGDITGIALGNSALEKPAFAGATLLSQIQAFTEQTQFNEGGKKMNLEEVKTFIKEEGLDPSEVFSIEQLKDDAAMAAYVAEKEKIARSGEFAHRDRTDVKFKEESAKWEAEKKKKDEEIKKLKVKGAKTEATGLFDKKVKERKLDDKQTKFIKAKVEDFTPADLEKLDAEVDKFMDTLLEEYKSTAAIFGHKVKEEKEETKEETKGGGEPVEGETEGDNPLIP